MRAMERKETSPRARSATSLAVVGALLLSACAATPEPAPELAPLAAPPHMELAAGHYAGTALAGARAGHGAADVEADPARLLDLELELLYLRRPPADLRPLAPDDLEPLAGGFELALDLGRGPAVLAAPRLFAGGLLVRGEPARTLYERLAAEGPAFATVLASHREVLGAGAAFELTADLRERVVDPDNFLTEYPDRPPVPKGLRVAIDAVTGNDPRTPRLSWCLSLAGALPADREAPTVPGDERFRPGSPAPAEELLRPSAPPVPGEPILVLVPSPFDTGAGRTLALLLQVDGPPTPAPGGEPTGDPAADEGATGAEDPERLVALQRALASIDLRAAALASCLAEAGTGDFLERIVPEALGRLERIVDRDEDPRSALLFLAGALDAPVAMDALLALSRRELVTLTRWLLADEVAGARSARWSLELHAWRALLAAVTEVGHAGPDHEPGTEVPAPLERTAGQRAALTGLVLRHAGEVGRFPRLHEALLAASVDEADLAARLAAENRVFLEDSSPAARVRAFDWLKARGLEPASYDPLAARGARRAALEAERQLLQVETEVTP